MIFSVYILREAGNPEIRYVGITSKSLSSRLYKHLKQERHRNAYKGRWIDQVLSKGGEIEIIPIVNNVESDIAESLEIFYIKRFRQLGFRLTNLTDGGERGTLGYRHTEEWKKNASIKRSGSGNAFFGRRHSPESLEKISKRVLSKESREKIAKSLTGRKQSEETLAKKRVSQRRRRDREAACR